MSHTTAICRFPALLAALVGSLLMLQAGVGGEMSLLPEPGGASPDQYRLAWWAEGIAEAPAEPLVQPPGPEEKAAAPPPPPPTLAARRPLVRLAGMPNMFGDFFGATGQIQTFTFDTQQGLWVRGAIDIPSAGGSGRVKIAENNKALPMNRAFFVYNHYENALAASGGVGAPRSFSIDRYTLGLEKTFCCDRWSAEVRMPFSSVYRFSTDSFHVEDGEVGNLTVSLKRLLWSNEITAVVAGLGVNVPTGSDVTGHLDGTDFAVRNQAVHLLPYAGLLRAPNDRWFLHGFLQTDIATNGNRVELDGQSLGMLTEQNLLHVDLSLGRWLYRNPRAYRLSGLAAVAEFHYGTTLQDADVVSGLAGRSAIAISNPFNRLDIPDLTMGLHAEIAKTSVRVGAIFPLKDDPDRGFDTEIQVSVNRRF